MFKAYWTENKQKKSREMKSLEEEYKKNAIFRKERVAELKKRIQNNQYQISGQAVVDKWFPCNAEDPGYSQE